MSSRDYEEFLESFNNHGVRYLVVGAHAVAFHAQPRATKDLDLLIDQSPENGRAALEAIRAFLGTDLGLSLDDLIDTGSIVQLGDVPSRIDILAQLSHAIDFDTAWRARAGGRFANVPTQYLALDDLIREKEEVGRDQDRADVKVLKMARRARDARDDAPEQRLRLGFPLLLPKHPGAVLQSMPLCRGRRGRRHGGNGGRSGTEMARLARPPVQGLGTARVQALVSPDSKPSAKISN
ncbi:MAG: hypothetical protein K8J08_22195 [Thermoanaerobaculia bacterium]|nr:hypothetical protein [Thermoanaerobaculia bacterium]